MTEEEARVWIEARRGADALTSMERLAEVVSMEAAHQNLIAPSTLTAIWSRHIVDSAQLLTLAGTETPTGVWIDIGSGAGFPGLVVAALSQYQVWLVEPRKRRAEFLQHAAHALGLADRVKIVCDRIQNVNAAANIISARAVAPLSDLFAWSQKCATTGTKWVIPKGRTAREDVATARETWHGVFHVEHSITDPGSLIVLASGVTRR